MRRLGVAILVAFLCALTGQWAKSQSVTGTVTDPGGAVIVGAPVQLINDVSQQKREAVSNGSGSFEFTSILPGTYTLRISQPGFKTYEQKNVMWAHKIVL